MKIHSDKLQIMPCKECHIFQDHLDIIIDHMFRYMELNFTVRKPENYLYKKMNECCTLSLDR